MSRFPELTSLAALRRALAMPTMWASGIAFSIPLLSILLAHEIGHYIACRRHRLDASLPYFLPIPLGIGTLGAFIRSGLHSPTKRELLRRRRGRTARRLRRRAACPRARHRPVPTGQPSCRSRGCGSSASRSLFKARRAPPAPGAARGSGDLLLHPTGFAAWFGLFATALNLLPFGQLDGGHVTYAMFGRRQRRCAWPLLLVLIALGFVWTGWWLWAVIALAMGVRHPRLPDEDVAARPAPTPPRLALHRDLPALLHPGADHHRAVEAGLRLEA